MRVFCGIVPDSTSTIVSDLLLQSELRGHIEEPDYYFRNCDSIADANFDLLLLTQGWERYDVPASLKGNFAEAEIPLEIGGSISGTVKSRWRGKPLEGAIVIQQLLQRLPLQLEVKCYQNILCIPRNTIYFMYFQECILST